MEYGKGAFITLIPVTSLAWGASCVHFDGQPKYVPVDLFSSRLYTEDSGKLPVQLGLWEPPVRRANGDGTERRRTLLRPEEEEGGNKGESSGELQMVVEPCSHGRDNDVRQVMVEPCSHDNDGDVRTDIYG